MSLLSTEALQDPMPLVWGLLVLLCWRLAGYFPPSMRLGSALIVEGSGLSWPRLRLPGQFQDGQVLEAAVRRTVDYHL